MHLKNQNILLLFCMAAFVCMALGCKVNSLHYGSFSYNNPIEGKDPAATYLVKNNGTKVYGKEITTKTGSLTKGEITIDQQQFKVSEIMGYRINDEFYGRVRNQYIKRIVHGKINVYVMFSRGTTENKNYALQRTEISSYTRTDHYAQIGEKAPLVAFGSLSDIQDLVAACPLAVEMASLSNAKLRKAIEADKNYLNSIFEIYNNGCKKSK